MRHSYATRLYESGVDLKTISVWMAHTDIVTTIKYYIHLLSAHEKSQAKLYETLIASRKDEQERALIQKELGMPDPHAA
jgi:integrase